MEIRFKSGLVKSIVEMGHNVELMPFLFSSNERGHLDLDWI